jgi:hypothetical protein
VLLRRVERLWAFCKGVSLATSVSYKVRTVGISIADTWWNVPHIKFAFNTHRKH